MILSKAYKIFLNVRLRRNHKPGLDLKTCSFKAQGVLELFLHFKRKFLKTLNFTVLIGNTSRLV
jgi:hypothetical protein